jgi:osomolarity two-component system sensor histidine kinase TcsA
MWLDVLNEERTSLLNQPFKLSRHFSDVNFMKKNLSLKLSECRSLKPEEADTEMVFEYVKMQNHIIISIQNPLQNIQIHVDHDFVTFTLDSDGVVSSWNVSCQNLFQYQADEIIGQHVSRFYVNAASSQADLAKCKEEGGFKDAFWRMKKNRQVFWSHVSMYPICDKQYVNNGYIVLIGDLSKDTETQRMLLENRLKTDLISNIVHEIKTPLQSLLSCVEMVRGSLGTSNIDTMTLIDESVASLLKIIMDLFSFSKIQSKEMMVSIDVFDVRETLTDIVSFLPTKNQDVNISVHVHPGTSQFILGEEICFREVMTNLIDNAVKFTAKGNVVVKVSECQNGFRFQVIDDGIGISQDDLSKLFLPFDKLDQSSRSQNQGTGMGLSVVKGIVEMLKGHIGVESEIGRGSMFWVELPFKSSHVDLDLGNQNEFPEPNKPDANIMLVEDNTINQTVISRMLKMIGYSNVTVASNGLQALRMSKHTKFDLILMDIQMPVMDGCDTTRFLRDDKIETPILAISTNVENKEKCFSVGMNDFLAKPFRLKTLYLKLNYWTV